MISSHNVLEDETVLDSLNLGPIREAIEALRSAGGGPRTPITNFLVGSFVAGLAKQTSKELREVMNQWYDSKIAAAF